MKESRYIMGWKSSGLYWSDAKKGWVDDPRNATSFNKDEGCFRVGKWVVENKGSWPVQLIDIDEFEGMFECPFNLDAVFLLSDGTPLILASLPKTKKDVIRLIGSNREVQYETNLFFEAIRAGDLRPLWEKYHSIKPDDGAHYLRLLGAENVR